MLTDSHCHLDQLDDVEQVLADARVDGVTQVVAVSEDPESMTAAVALKRRFPGQVLAGVGLHPAWVVQHDPGRVNWGLDQVAAHLPAADVLGEVGLDHKWATDADLQQRQVRTLEAQFELAAANRKPVNLHSRQCLRQTMEQAIAFHRDTGLPAQLHWFTHSRKLVRICNDEGIYVSVGPTVLASPDTQAVAAEISLELLLVESDAPVPVRGRAGRPRHVRAVAELVAALKGVPYERLARQLHDNFSRYIGADPQS